MSRALPRALLLALLLAASPWARADSPQRLLVLGPDGRPVDRVFVTYVRERHEERPVLDVGPEGDLIELERGVLPGLDPWPGHVILWRTDAAPVALGPTSTVSGVRLLAGLPLEGRLRFTAGVDPTGREVLAVPTRAGGIVHRAHARKDGTFAFPRLARGGWRLFVRRGDQRLQDIGVFPAGTSAEAEIASGGIVRGTLLDGEASKRTPLAGCRLRILALPGGETPAGTGPEVQTDAAGRFHLVDLPAGVWEMRLDDDTLLLDPARPRFEARARRDIDLPPVFAIRRVSVEGRVVDLKERPVAGARISLALAPGIRRSPIEEPLPEPVVSDAAGAYRFEHVRTGQEYRIRARADGFAYRVGKPFVVARGTTTTVDPLVLHRGWRLEARLRSEAGKRAPGVLVRARPAARAAGKTDDAWVEAVTDADGIAVLLDLPPEEVRVFAGGDPWLELQEVVGWPRTGPSKVWNGLLERAPRLRGRVVLESGGPADGLRVRARPRDGSAERVLELKEGGFFETRGLPVVPIDLHVEPVDDPRAPALTVYSGAIPGDTEYVRILVPRRYAIEGRVTGLDPDGERAEVRLEAPVPEPEDPLRRWRTVRSVVLPAGGRQAFFRLEGIGPGPHALRVVQGYVDSGPVPVWIDGRDVEGLAVMLPAGGTIAGTVLDARPDPLLGAFVTLTRLRGDGDAPEGDHAGWTKATTQDGSFAFVGVAPGLWRVRCAFEDLADVVRIVRVGEGETVVLKDVLLGPGGSLAGLLRDESGTGFDGLRLELDALAEGVPSRHVRTRSDGHFVVENLPPGLWRVRVRSKAGPYTNLEALVEIQADERLEVELTPGGRATLDGRVTRRGLPVPNVPIRLVALSTDETEPLRRLETHTDPGGHFYWDELPPGHYMLDVQDGVVRSSRAVRLREMDRLSLDLEVWSGRVGGHVRAASGRRIGGALVEAKPSGTPAPGFSSAIARTNPEGGFVFAGLPPGRYDLTASAAGLPPGRSRAVDARVSSTVEDLEIVLGEGGHVEIDVQDAWGRGVSGARIWIETQAGVPLHHRAFAVSWSGRLRIEGVPPGTRWIRVEARGYGRPPRRKVLVEEGETRELRFVLPPSARLEVVVKIPGRDALPLARLDLRREGDDAPFFVRERLQPIRLTPGGGRVPRSGRLWIEDLAPGAYVLEVRAGPRFEPQSLPIVVQEGEDEYVEVRMERREED